ncbi:hypothetical protein HYV49_05930 [Candidatus Pacearchaeota archaeon]|nr:hypothetical protein [Candidatus Pacearchaeota archaeon]
MTLEDKFTKEGMPIVEEDFKNQFFFDLEMDARTNTSQAAETIAKFVKEIQTENPVYNRSIKLHYSTLKERFSNPETIELIISQAIGFTILREQGEKYVPSFKMPVVDVDSNNEIGENVANEKFYELSYNEINKENPIYLSLIEEFVQKRVKNGTIFDYIMVCTIYHYKLLKEQAKKDGLGEKIRKMGKT